jgi:hypothetical protein
VNFTVTSINASAAGTLVTHEALSLESAPTGMRLRLASDDGSTLTKPITLDADGEIASPTQDAAVTCYNMAVDALTRIKHPSAGPALAYVRIGNSIVPIPLSIDATHVQGNAHRTVLSGTSSGTITSAATSVDAGIIIKATILDNGDALRGATFDELQYLQTPSHVIGHSTCIISRSALAGTSRT